MIEVDGRCDALQVALTVLIATHPRADEVREALQHVLQSADSKATLTTSDAAYNRGWRQTMNALISNTKAGH